MHNGNIDQTDKEIIAILQENARTSNAEIARQIGKAPSVVLERIRKMERSGVIQGYEVKVSPKAMGKPLTAFTFVRTEEAVGSTESGQKLADFPDVLEVHHTAGHDCYLLKVRVADTEALSELLKGFGRIGEVRDTNTTIVLSTVKEKLGLDILTGEPAENGKE